MAFDVFPVAVFRVRKSCCFRFSTKQTVYTDVVDFETIFLSVRRCRKDTPLVGRFPRIEMADEDFSCWVWRAGVFLQIENLWWPGHVITTVYRSLPVYPGAARTVTRPIRRTCVEPITRRACRTRRLWQVFPRTFTFCITATGNASSSGVRLRATAAARLRVVRIIRGTHQ